ncbi:MAG: response regulator [Ignavibacteriales bacterium]|nr:response regulator [Ignavibacteriales bacterium]
MTTADALRILIIDDERSFGLGLEMALKMNGLAAKSVDSAETAVELLENDVFDVIIVDYSMPGMNGVDFLKWMKEHQIDTPVLMVTGAGSENIAVEAMKSGAYDYFRKEHVDTERLTAEIKNIYEQYRVAREKKEMELEQRRAKEREKELESLQMFEGTLNSIRQFVENGLASLSRKVQMNGEPLLPYVKEEGKGQFKKFLDDVKIEIELVGSGAKSISDFSALVARKLESIQAERKRLDAENRPPSRVTSPSGMLS